MTDTEQLIHQLSASGAKKPMRHPLTITAMWMGVFTLYVLLIMLVMGIRPDMPEKWIAPMFILEVGGMALVAITAALSASFLALPDEAGKPWMKYLCLFPLMLFLGVLIYGLNDDSTLSFPECIRRQHFPCSVEVILFSLIPSATMFYTLAKAAPTRPSLAGCMAALSGSAFGYVVIRMLDTHDDPMSLLVWHFSPVILVVLVGMIMGRWILGKK